MGPLPGFTASHAEEEGYGDPKPWQRFYMGYHERFVEDCVIDLRSGTKVHIAQSPSAKCTAKKLGQKLDKKSDPALTGTTVWDGAILLSQYLTSTNALQGVQFPSGCPLPTCLELGAGTGTVSLCLAAANSVACVTMTDIPDVLPHLQLNLTKNADVIPPGTVHINPLIWGQEQDILQLDPIQAPFDLIVGSDLIYYTYSEDTPHSKLLLWTLERVACPETLIYLALSLHHNPEEVDHFLGLATEKFTVKKVTDVPEEWRVPDVMIVLLKLRLRE